MRSMRASSVSGDMAEVKCTGPGLPGWVEVVTLDRYCFAGRLKGEWHFDDVIRMSGLIETSAAPFSSSPMPHRSESLDVSALRAEWRQTSFGSPPSRSVLPRSEGTGSGLSKKKRFYILFVSRDEDGTLNKVPVPLHYAYVFVAAAAIGMFTITGMAGSYSRMLIKTARFNQLRQDHDSLRKDYASLEQQAKQKDVQAASLGSLASEISALYGLTANKISTVRGSRAARAAASVAVVNAVATAPLKDTTGAKVTAGLSSDGYYKSVDSFYALRTQALSGDVTRLLTNTYGIDRMRNPLLPGHDFGGSLQAAAFAPTLWPVTGPITSSFGEREDPVLGTGEGEFHPGLDISGPLGTPIHATGDGVVIAAEMVNGYGRMVEIDHGHGVVTRYGHMSGFAVTVGQSVARGEVVGFIGHSGRTTGNHVHYEVRINGAPVNPHKYLRTTLAELGSGTPAGM
jgi:murein DD-endopeptidase MepM/ murein hydrolase activator NlpD